MAFFIKDCKKYSRILMPLPIKWIALIAILLTYGAIHRIKAKSELSFFHYTFSISNPSPVM